MGLFERFIEKHPVETDQDHLPSGVLGITSIQILSGGRLVRIEAVQTDTIGNTGAGIFTLIEAGSRSDRLAVSEEGDIVSLPVPYRRVLAGPAAYQNTQAALGVGERTARKLHKQERRQGNIT